MANQDNYRNDTDRTYVRETRTTEGSGGGMALLVGGLVVAVGFILWLVFGGPGPVATTTEPASETTNVTIEPPAAPADTTTNVTIDPAPDATAPEAPADDAAPAPTEPAPAAPATPPANP